jgi:hypothetical protein
MFDELETVVLKRDIPEAGLKAGDVGAVVYCYVEAGYEVEFVAGDGAPLGVLTLPETDLRGLAAREILHARGF